jgi:hypothetical protein
MRVYLQEGELSVAVAQIGTLSELREVVVGHSRRDGATVVDGFLQLLSSELLHHVHLVTVRQAFQRASLHSDSPADQLAHVRVGRCAAAGVDVKLRATVLARQNR